MVPLNRQRVFDLAVVVVAGAAGALLLQEALRTRQLPGHSLPLDLALGALGCLGLFVLRRSRPAPLALVLLAAMAFSVSAWGPAGAAVHSVAVRCRNRTRVAIGGTFAVVVLLYHLLYSTGTETARWSDLLVEELLLAILLTSGSLMRSRVLLVESLRERAVQAEERHQLRLEEARRLEREQIAREMHDVLAHRISLLAMQAGALEFRLGRTGSADGAGRTGDPRDTGAVDGDREVPGEGAAEVRQAVGAIRESAYAALEDLREVVGVLRDDSAGPHRPQPVLADLPELLEESRRAGMSVDLQLRLPDVSAVPAGQGRHLYRIVQEALTNARKHAPGAPVRVLVDGAPDSGLVVDVRNRVDPGSGARMPGAGVGLAGLAERARLAGGRIDHGVDGTGDFRLRAELPWQP